MIDQDIALQFDRALDGEDGISLNGSQSLLTTADTMQALYDQQHPVPSPDFVTRLERTLFAAHPPVIPVATSVIPTEAEESPPIVIPTSSSVIPTGVEGPSAAAAVPPKPTPFPPRIAPARSRLPRRWFAIAAVLALILGGGGALVVGPFDLHSTPEPSAIPAFGFGTVEASPAPTEEWRTVRPNDAGLEWSERLFSKRACAQSQGVES
jgi:hypothetical protein